MNWNKLGTMIVLFALLAVFTLTAPVLAQEATPDPISTITPTLEPTPAVEPPIVVEVPADEDFVPVDVVNSFIDTLLKVLAVAGTVIVGLVIFMIRGLVALMAINPEAAKKIVPPPIALRLLQLAEIGAKLTKDPKDDEEVKKAREAYESSTGVMPVSTAVSVVDVPLMDASGNQIGNRRITVGADQP